MPSAGGWPRLPGNTLSPPGDSVGGLEGSGSSLVGDSCQSFCLCPFDAPKIPYKVLLNSPAQSQLGWNKLRESSMSRVGSERVKNGQGLGRQGCDDTRETLEGKASLRGETIIALPWWTTFPLLPALENKSEDLMRTLVGKAPFSMGFLSQDWSPGLCAMATSGSGSCQGRGNQQGPRESV